jgi:hypothetical protein
MEKKNKEDGENRPHRNLNRKLEGMLISEMMTVKNF